MEFEGPVIVGIDGFIEGEIFPLKQGMSVIIGRSRSCDLSFRKCKRWLALDEEKRDAEKDFHTVSRRHLRISFNDQNEIVLEDLASKNGTFVNKERLSKLAISDIKEKTYEVLLGSKEKFRIEWRKMTIDQPEAKVPDTVEKKQEPPHSP